MTKPTRPDARHARVTTNTAQWQETGQMRRHAELNPNAGATQRRNQVELNPNAAPAIPVPVQAKPTPLECALQKLGQT
jgi:hypothetical protein